MGSGDGTEVDLVALTQYAQDMGKIADDHFTWMQGAIKDMASTAGYMIENAAPTFTASTAYHHYHQAIVNGVTTGTGLLFDVWKGLGAYSEAAETAAINYANLEQLGTVDMSKVGDELQKDPSKMYELFAPVFGAKGDATVNVDGQTVDHAFNPGKGDLLQSDGTQPDDGNKNPANAPSKTDIDNQWNQMVGQSNHDLKTNPDGSTLSQQQKDMVYGDHGYTVPNSTGVQVPANTVTRQDIEGNVTPDNPLK